MNRRCAVVVEILLRFEVDRRYFLTKNRYFCRYPTIKALAKFFDTVTEKGVPNRKTRFPQKKNKRRCNVFCFKLEAIVHRNVHREESLKKLEKPSFIQKKRYSVPSSSTLFMEGKIVRQLDSRFFILLNS